MRCVIMAETKKPILPDGFDFVLVPETAPDEICLDIKTESINEFTQWLSELSQKINVAWRKARGDRQFRHKLVIDLVCNHASTGQKGVKITDTK